MYRAETCKLIHVYEVMRKFDKGSRWDIIPLNLLGQYQNMRIIDPGVSLIQFIIWKFTLIVLTQLTKDGPAHFWLIRLS